MSCLGTATISLTKFLVLFFMSRYRPNTSEIFVIDPGYFDMDGSRRGRGGGGGTNTAVCARKL